jgi:hypothetical protein
VVQGASSLGYLGGLAIVGADQDADGLTVREGSALTVGSVDVRGFASEGILVAGNATLLSEDGVTVDVTGCGAGFTVLDSGVADFTGASTIRASSNAEDGFVVGYGSVLVAHGAQSDSNGNNGFGANYASSLVVEDSSAYDNVDVDYRADNRSLIDANRAKATNASGHTAFFANTGSYIYAGYAEIQTDYRGFLASLDSSIYANAAEVVGTPSVAYYTSGNSYIYAPNNTGLTTATTSYNDTTDFIYGI